jgi:type IV secretory pathway ATPase VirB11/archaellum biosynthesis ATPase
MAEKIEHKSLLAIDLGTKTYQVSVSDITKEHGIFFYNLYGPTLSTEEKDMFFHAYAHIKTKLTDKDVKTTLEKSFYYIRDLLKKIAHKKRIEFSDTESVKIAYLLYEDLLGLGPVESLYADPDVLYVYCKGLGHPVYVNHERFGLMRTNVIFKSKLKYGSMVWRLLQKCKEHSSDGLSGILPDNGFVQTTNELEFSIRKAKYDFGAEYLLRTRTLSPGALAYLWMVMQKKCPILIVGPKGSGKTRLISGLLTLLPKDAKVSVVEDKPSMGISRIGWSSHVAALENPNKMKLLYEESRKSPDYFVFDSLDDKSANYVFQYLAMCPGIISLEAKNTDAGIHHLTGYKVRIPRSALANFDVAITLKPDRKVEEIVEILRHDEKSDELVIKPVFECDRNGNLVPLESRFLRSLSENGHRALHEKAKEFMELIK